MIQATLPRRTAPNLDLASLDLAGLAKAAFKPWADAYDAWGAGVSDLVRARPAATGCGCGCPSCLPDPCACRCCVADADLVVEARVGERRIVPITIENRWRREREIEIELSSWTKLDDGLAVRGDLLTPATFALAPCGEAQVVVALTIGPAANEPVAGAAPKTLAREKLPAAAAATTNVRDLPDVDTCRVAYADLRIKGCDMRAIRMAVAVLPRDCGAYVADCACGCC